VELIKIKRKNGTFRLASKPSGASKTDQSDKNMVDINLIMERYAKTGVLPHFKEKIAQYLDVTELPSYMEAQKQISEAKELFNQLPAKVRKLMNNNPAKLEEFIEDPDNEDILLKYKLIEKVQKKVDSSSRSEKDDPTTEGREEVKGDKKKAEK
jgi:phage internal scaffolding protein